METMGGATMRILNPELIQTQSEGSVSILKILLTVIAAPIGTLWMVIFIPFAKGKKAIYRQYKELGDAWSQ